MSLLCTDRLKKVNNRLDFRSRASKIRSKLFLALAEKNLKPRTKKIVVLLLWHEGLSPHKKSGDLIFRSGTDRSKIRETPS